MPNGFKVMIVTSSREAAVTYKKKLDEIPDAPDSAVIISGDHNDPPEMMQWTNKTDHQKAIDLYDVLGEGLTCHYESEEIPSSKYALDYWKVNGQ